MSTPTLDGRPRNPGERIGALVLAGGGVLACLGGMLDSLNFTVDDSFISLRFAENLARGHGLVFNVGERVEGYSNLLWTLMLAVLARLGANQSHSDLALLIAAKGLGAFFGVATLALTAWVAGRLARREEWGEHAWLLWTAVLGLGSAYSFVTWSMSGMETSLCAFLMTAGVALTVLGLRAGRESERTQLPLLVAGGVGFGLTSLTRPEPVAVWAAAMAAALWLSAPRERRGLVVACVPMVLLQAGLLIWRHHYYGTWIPNSVVAKFGGGPMSALLGAKYTLSCLVGSVGVLALGFLGLPGLLRRGVEWKFLACVCGAYLGFVAVSGGDWMPGYRFLVPALPALWLLGSGALAETVHRLQPRVAPWTAAAIVLVLAAGSFSEGRFLVRSQIDYPSGLKQRSWVGSPERVAIAKELRGIIPPGTTLAVAECGFIPYFNPGLRILDLFGLMEPGIARLPGMHTHKLTAEYFLSRRPAYYLMMVKRTSQGAEGEFVPSHPDGETLLAAPLFLAGYRRMQTFNGFVLYRRRD